MWNSSHICVLNNTLNSVDRILVQLLECILDIELVFELQIENNGARGQYPQRSKPTQRPTVQFTQAAFQRAGDSETLGQNVQKYDSHRTSTANCFTPQIFLAIYLERPKHSSLCKFISLRFVPRNRRNLL